MFLRHMVLLLLFTAMAICVTIQLTMALWYLVWSCMAFYSLIWYSMVFYGRKSSFLTVIDPKSFENILKFFTKFSHKMALTLQASFLTFFMWTFCISTKDWKISQLLAFTSEQHFECCASQKRQQNPEITLWSQSEH